MKRIVTNYVYCGYIVGLRCEGHEGPQSTIASFSLFYAEGELRIYLDAGRSLRIAHTILL